MLAILKNINFSKIFWAGLASQLGSFVTETALMLLVFSLSGDDKAILGISKTTFLIFLTLGSLLGGPIGNKYDRRKVLIFCEYIRIPLVLFLFLFQDNIYLIILLDGLIAFFTGIFNPSRQTLINEVTTKETIQAANSIFSTSLAAIHMIGPFVGAWLYSYFSGINEILIFDLFTYLIGIALISRLKYINNESKESSNSNLFTDLKEGLSYVKSRSDLMIILICVLLSGFCIGVLIPLLLPFTLEFLGKDEQTYGTIMAFFGIGGLIGAPIYQSLTSKISSSRVIVIGFFTEPLLMIWWTHTQSLTLSVLIIFIWGISVFIRIPAQLTYFSQTVEIKYMTRVHALLDMAFMLPNIFGSLFVGLIGNANSAQQTLAQISFLFFGLIYPTIFFPGMRSLWKNDVKIIEN